MNPEIRANSTNAVSVIKAPIIVLGASAGGLMALQEFFTKLPIALHNCIFIVAQHLGHTQKSKLVSLLQKVTPLHVEEAKHNMLLKPGNIFVSPADEDLLLVKGRIKLQAPENIALSKPSIDLLFSSLANIKASPVFALVLSGTGTDGSIGIEVIKESGGTVIVQDPASAKFSSMPASAIGTGFVDLICKPNMMGKEIVHFLAAEKGVNDESVEQIFKLLNSKSGTDFSNYKSASIYRRIGKRLEALQIKNTDDYLAYINKKPTELDELYNTILISVTDFFRDPEAFEALEKYLTEIVVRKNPGDNIRIWVAGCATGEEAYTIAILLSFIQKSNSLSNPVQIFASDIDTRALAIARKGIYHKQDLIGVPGKYISDYFTQKGNDHYEVVGTLKKMILFSKHDITSNPPFLKIDLITCRNLIIYFGLMIQKHIIPVFHYALLPDGYLMLGKSESIIMFDDLFTTLDSKNKIYQRKAGSSLHSIKFSLFSAPNYSKQGYPNYNDKNKHSKELIKETLLSTLEYPYVVVNDHADIQEVGGDPRLFISLPAGTMNANLFKLVNKELQIESRTVFSQVLKTNQPGKTKMKRFYLYNHDHYVVVNIKPIIQAHNNQRLFLVLFETIDLPNQVSLPILSETSVINARIHELDTELSATRIHLQNYIDELELTNQELQSLNEELQSTNEELQSTSEEQQKGNEELQESNDGLEKDFKELESANEILRLKEIEIKKTLFRGDEGSRRVIGLNLHENIAQLLVSSKIFMALYASNKKEATLNEALKIISETVKQIINLTHVVSMLNMDDLGLKETLWILLKQLNETGKVNFTFNCSITEIKMTPDLKINIYRIVQELTDNVLNYSAAKSAVLNLVQNEKQLEISIKDNGVGFDMHKIHEGNGFKNIRTRISLFDATMGIISKPKKGCAVKILFNGMNQ